MIFVEALTALVSLFVVADRAPTAVIAYGLAHKQDSLKALHKAVETSRQRKVVLNVPFQNMLARMEVVHGDGVGTSTLWDTSGGGAASAPPLLRL